MRKRTTQQWLAIFKQQAASGLSVSEFCRQHKMCASYFGKRKRQMTGTATNKFIQVTAPKMLPPTTAHHIELHYQQVHLQLPLSIDMNNLALLVKQLT